MNKGKMWKYFFMVVIMGVYFDYVMKVDDDLYVCIYNFVVFFVE